MIIVKVISLIVLIIGIILFAKITMSNPNKICFSPEPGDTNSFGSSVAINDKYLAVGDPNANCVVMHQRNLQDQWRRNRIIFPPNKYKVHINAGRGFGRTLSLDGNILIVNSVTREKTTRTYLVNPNNFKDFLQKDLRNSEISFQKYIFNLERKIKVTQIERIRSKRKEFTNFYILHNGELKLVTLPNNNEEMFGSSIAIHNNMMLVGSLPSRMKFSSETRKRMVV